MKALGPMLYPSQGWERQTVSQEIYIDVPKLLRIHISGGSQQEHVLNLLWVNKVIALKAENTWATYVEHNNLTYHTFMIWLAGIC